jgi:hypothetical protein
MSRPGKLYFEGTLKNPEIDFDSASGNLILSGKSIPENAARIYEPVIDWAKEYIKDPPSATNLHLNLEYFNTATTIWIAKFIRVISTIERPDHVLTIHFYMDIEDSDTLDIDETRDIVTAMVGNIGHTVISIGIKLYGTGPGGKILKESRIFI